MKRSLIFLLVLTMVQSCRIYPRNDADRSEEDRRIAIAALDEAKTQRAKIVKKLQDLDALIEKYEETLTPRPGNPNAASTSKKAHPRPMAPRVGKKTYQDAKRRHLEIMKDVEALDEYIDKVEEGLAKDTTIKRRL